MNLLRRLSGWRLRRDWEWDSDRQRPTLLLRFPIRPGWYLLTVRLISDQLRCYSLLNGQQGRTLVSGKQRRRLVRIGRGAGTTRFEIHGLNGNPVITTLRLVPLPIWRVKKLLARKLMTLHPAYRREFFNQRQLPQQWRDYNHLLSRKSFPLVGYDDWIERVEFPALVAQQEKAAASQSQARDADNVISFAIWLWGERENDLLLQQSIESLQRQLPGPFRVLDPEYHLAENDHETWVVFLRVGDQLPRQAIARFATVLRTETKARILYGDEDFLFANGRRHSPQFKPAWNPDFLFSNPAYSSSWVIRADLCVRACQTLDSIGEKPDLYALVLEATALCAAKQILHLPEILYHRLDRAGETHSSSHTASILQAFLARQGRLVHVSPNERGGHVLCWPLPSPPPLVSIVIATRDNGDLLRCCLTSLAKHAQSNPPTELILIDNGSIDPETIKYLGSLERQDNVRVLRRPGKFNYSALNNEGVALARGDLIALINNDVEATHSGWLTTMAAQALRPEIGAVGAKLLFPDGTIQHGGILLGIGGIAGHAHKYFRADCDGYQLRLRVAHNVSAVTAAALVVRRSLYQQVGGLNAEDFAVNYNDVDFCLRLLMAGYRNLFCPEAVLVHHESKSRGAPTSGDAHAQWQGERNRMLRRWKVLLEADPNYSPHLSLTEENLSLSLRPIASPPRRSAPNI